MPARRILQHACALVALGSFAVVCAMGCVDAEATFLVRNVAAFDDSCACDPTGDEFLSGGSFETSLGGDYAACLVVINGLDQLEDRNKPRAETNYVEIYAVDVSLEGFEATPDCPASFTFPSKGFVEPESVGPVIALAVPNCVTRQLQGSLERGTTTTLIANFVVHGHTSGGDEIETPEYSFPISVGRAAYCTGEEVEPGAAVPCRAGSDKPAPANLCD
jgi:hypothetical protein